MWNSIFNIYHDEILYSALGRLGALYGFNSCREYINKLYGTGNLVPTLWFPGRLEYWTKKFPIGINLTSDNIIREHSMYPLYSPFMDRKTQKYVRNKMKNGYAGGITHKVGIVAGGICRKRELYFCSECAIEEFEILGEAYFHRIHQVEGVLACEKHERVLIPYNKLEMSRLEYVYLSKDDVLKGYVSDGKVDYPDLLKWLNREFEYLLNNDLKLDKSILHGMYLRRLQELDLALPSGSVRQRELFCKFTEHYPYGFLKLLESNIDSDNNYNWLKVITRNSKRASHPIRHVLLIGFLFGSIEELLNYTKSIKKSKEKYPCLNPACQNYLSEVINEGSIRYDYKAKKTVGTFTCICGFIYTRDMSKNDKYSLGRIKDFGDVWKEALMVDIFEGRNISEIAERLKCDKKTVIRQALILGLGDMINTKYKDISEYNSKYGFSRDKNITLSQLHKPEPYLSEKLNRIKNMKRVDWERRDVEILAELMAAIPVLYRFDRKTRVSRTKICNFIGKYSLISKNATKLPKTTKFIEENTETLSDFQCFRVDRASENILFQGFELARWRIVREAGLREPLNEIVEGRIFKWIK